MSADRAVSFVSPRHKTCPSCGEELFGRLMVNGRSYVRRCDVCRYSQSFDLPDIRKAIVYRRLPRRLLDG
jgi:hypothetical protein